MTVEGRVVGVRVAEQRPLAGWLVGWMYFVGAILTTLLPLLPGANGKVVTPTLPLGIVAGLWGLYAALRMDWSRTPGWVIHAAVVLGALSAAVATSDTGGASSPARFLLMLALVYSAYFFPSREAWPYLALVLVLHALPLAYDEHAGQLVGEVMIIAPIYALLTALLITGRTSMVALQAEAYDLARRDPLTGVANRRALLEALQREGERRVGLLMLDVDDFKRTNTLHGHPGGDRALVFVAQCLRAACREEDLAARLGGDEFALLARGIDEAGMEALAARLLAGVRARDGVRISAGWVVGPADAEQLLAAADAALARAKRAGKDRALSYASA
jgi:diguanylate cyclase (GGDEF)-like protein